MARSRRSLALLFVLAVLVLVGVSAVAGAQGGALLGALALAVMAGGAIAIAR
jgi:ABC-type methionine transport system permease subunit